MPDAIYSAGDFSSQARFLFERFTGPDGVANIRALVHQTPKVPETNWLEFKSGLTRSEDLKNLWSKALGSFANSGGGVVIWGVRAERDPATGIDAVQEEVPVPDVDVLISRLKDLQPPATDPPIKGVILHPVLIHGEATKGFIVCFIPESDSKPHRSEFGKNDVKRFNIRIGDSTQECNVPLLRQLFYPKYSPKLEVSLGVYVPPNLAVGDPRMYNWERVNYYLYFTLHNAGTLSIDDIVVSIKCGGNAIIVAREGEKPHQLITVEPMQSLHPKLSIDLPLMLLPNGDATDSTNWVIKVFARNMSPQSATILHGDVTKRPWLVQTVSCTDMSF